MKEEWRAVVEWEGVYEISNYGRVKRVKAGMGASKGKTLCLWKNTGKYLCADLRDNGRRKCCPAHCLVAAAFIGPRTDGKEVNHIDGVRTNNRLENLEYVTHQENIKHAWRIGLMDDDRCVARGERHHLNILSEDEVRQIRGLLKEGVLSQTKIARIYNVSKQTISAIKFGRSWAWLE